MSKAGYFARPVGVDGKRPPPSSGKDEQKPPRWSETVHKVADTVRGWLSPSDTAKKD
jgi:hypothetical protein